MIKLPKNYLKFFQIPKRFDTNFEKEEDLQGGPQTCQFPQATVHKSESERGGGLEIFDENAYWKSRLKLQ